MYGMDRRVRDAAVARPEGPAPIMITTGSGSDITAAAAGGGAGGGGFWFWLLCTAMKDGNVREVQALGGC